MVTIQNLDGQTITFSKSSFIKIVSKDNVHTIYFVNGTEDSFEMSQIDFVVNVTNRLS